MPIRALKDVVISSSKKSGKIVKIKVLVGPLNGKEFQAKKVEENLNGQVTNCYHVDDNGVNTYFLEKDIITL